MNAVIMSFDPNEKQCNLREKAMKSARKAKDKLHKACERASEIRKRTLHTLVGRNKTECAWQA